MLVLSNVQTVIIFVRPAVLICLINDVADLAGAGEVP